METADAQKRGDGASGMPVPALRGTTNQVEWATRIRTNVGSEFDRVAKALERVCRRQTGQDRTDTETLISILEEKRAEVLARDQAGYFIRDWQELRGQVRRLMAREARCQAIQVSRAARRDVAPA